MEQTDIDTLLKKTSFFSLGKIGESSGFVMYLFRQQNELPISFFEDNENFSDDKICVFVDDMTLSGDQALRNISKIKYGDWRVKDDEIAGFEKVFRKKGDNFIKAVKSHINAKLEGRYFQKEINRLLRSETFFDDYCEQISFESIDENLQFLLDKYRDDRESMSEYAIRKMNRLIFENLYPADISKSRGVIRNDQIVLLTFFASATAKKTLADEHINVIYCIELDNSSRAFAADSMTFANFPQEKDDCLKMCNYYGKKINFKNPLGYNDCQYLIGLYYNTPNNSLPIFWGSKHWNPIFIRHEKKYGGQAYVGGQFI